MSSRVVLIPILLCIGVGVVTLVWLDDGNPASGDSSEPRAVVPRIVIDENAHPDLVLPAAMEQVVQPLAPRGTVAVLAVAETGDGAAQAAESGLDLPHVPRGSNTHRLFVDPNLFELRYAEASMEELVLAKHHVETEYFELLPQAIDDVFERGLYEEEIIEAPISGDLTYPDATPSFGLGSVSRAVNLDDGRRLIKRAEIPWEEYQHVYDLQDETLWLGREIRDRKRASR